MKPYRLELLIPGLPKRTNNNKGHWTTRYEESRKWKSAVNARVIYNKLGPRRPLSRARVTLTRYSSVEPDFDGLVSSFKHVIDGLIASKVLVNDTSAVIGQPSYQWKTAAPKKGFITIVVEELAE